jgi:hypothetical protein
MHLNEPFFDFPMVSFQTKSTIAHVNPIAACREIVGYLLPLAPAMSNDSIFD